MARTMVLMLCLASLIVVGVCSAQPADPIEARDFSGKKLGTIFNNDDNNITWGLENTTVTIADYRRVLNALLDMKPGVLAQMVGYPDPVIYRSKVATFITKYLQGGRDMAVLDVVTASGTDVLDISIQECRKRGVAIVPSYRMNGGDYYERQKEISDFAREHLDWMIPETSVMDPAIPHVYEHRMKIFTEVARERDIDGIEFDFRRWYYMVSDPLKNHTVLTRMVRDTRRMLDKVAKEKGRKRLILGVRVGPSLDTEPNAFLFPGMYYVSKPVNASCKELGLDVKTWIKEGLVDYVCPSVFLPSLPGLPLTEEFAKLAKGTKTGVYPTVFPLASWMHGVCERKVTMEDKDIKALALYKHDLCSTVLKAYEDGADGISTFNWYSHMRNGGCTYLFEGEASSGAGAEAVQTYIYPLMKSPKAVKDYMKKPWAVPPK